MMFKLSFAVTVAVVAGSSTMPALPGLEAAAGASPHAVAARGAKMALLKEAKAPNQRSKAMEKKAQKARLEQVDHKAEMADAEAKKESDAYEQLSKKCIACKLAEDAVVSQLQEVVMLHDKADFMLDEYNKAKNEAEGASLKADDLALRRDEACSGEPA